MASSSRPFQSQTVSRLVAGYHQLVQGAERLLRQGRLALVWGLQVAVYPAYVAFQGIRTGYRRLLATHPWARVRQLWTGALPPLRLVATDTPIRSLLALIQPPAVSHQGGLRPVDHQGQFLRQSQAGQVLTKGQWHLLPLTTRVRGVASDLVSRQLVLVTANNEIFDDLTTDQQARLQRAIVLLLAEYARVCRLYWLDRQRRSPGLPLPRAETAQWLPFRWLQGGMRWMQTSSLAISTNLFGEASQWQRWLRSRQQTAALEPSPHLAARGGTPAIEGTPYSQAPLLGTSPWGQGGSQGVTILTSVAVEPMPPLTHAGTVENHLVSSPNPLVRGEVPNLSTPLQPESGVIEANVTLIDYVNHPLAQLLRWIDQAMHTLETWLVQLWRWLRMYL